MPMFEFILIGALWGGSFLFMRLAGPFFGPVSLIGVRVMVAGILLLPFTLGVTRRGLWRENRYHLFFLGLTSAAAPFTLLTYCTLKTSAGFAAILNSTAPIFTAIVASVWLKEIFSFRRMLGLLLGVGGVVALLKGKISFDETFLPVAVLSALSATALYGFSTNYIRKYLTNLDPLVVTVATQLSAGIWLLPGTIHFWPDHNPDLQAWMSVLALGAFSTGAAFVLFYRLLHQWGPSRAMTVTFLVPVFGMLWGNLFLGESVTLNMILSCAVIVLGTWLSLVPSLINREKS